MKRFLIYLLVFVSSTFYVCSQSDTTFRPLIEPKLSLASGSYSGSPADSASFEFSKFALYLSFGYGYSGISYASGFGFDCSLSIAYKSSIFTATGLIGGNNNDGTNNSGNSYGADYLGILYGIVNRTKNSMISASIGVAKSHAGYDEYGYANIGVNYFTVINTYRNHNNFSIPFEVNFFLLANNGVGIGLHLSLDIGDTYSPASATLSFVLGSWRDPPTRKHNKQNQ